MNMGWTKNSMDADDDDGWYDDGDDDRGCRDCPRCQRHYDEIASLREQLKIYQRNTEDQDSTIVYLNEQLKLSKEIGIEKGEQLADAKAKKLLFDKIKETEINVLREELKQQEEVIRELMLVAEGYIYYYRNVHPNDEFGKIKDVNSLIEKAKSLTTKDK